jgi:hypothetical protein
MGTTGYLGTLHVFPNLQIDKPSARKRADHAFDSKHFQHSLASI